MVTARILAVLAAALVGAGCGSEPQRPPDVGTPQPPGQFVEFTAPAQGVRMLVPGAWTIEQGTDGVLVAKLTSGRATIAVWRYPRTEPLPRTRSDLEATRDSLVAAVKARDPAFTVTSTRIIRTSTRRGVEIIGTGTNSGFPRRVRSLHLFRADAEIVLDQYATPEQFATVDDDVFRDVERSLRVTRPS